MKTKYIILVIVVLGIIGGFAYLNKERVLYKAFPSEIITQLDIDVAPDIREFTENRIAERLNIIADETSEQWEVISAHVSVGNDYVILGDLAQAKKEVEKALSFNQNNAPVLVTYANVLERMQDTKGAFDAIERAIVVRPEEPQAWLFKLKLEEKYRKVYASLENVYQEALAATGYDLTIVVNYARFLSRTGKTQDSIAMWKQAQELYPANTELYQIEIDQLEGEKKVQ